MEYMNNLIYSKREVMKRNLCDIVDGFHKEEKEDLVKDLKFAEEDMKEWEKKQSEPVNFEVFVIGKMKK